MSKLIRVAIVLSFFVSTTILISRGFRTSKIPNGNKFDCANCHVNPSGGGVRNSFGKAVEALVSPGGFEDFWNENLANIDSDGDGFTNGQELQDPAGLWRTGQPNPGDINLVTNPGDPNSKPAPTSLDDIILSAKYELHNNFPNPFNPSTNISFTIPRSEFVTLKIYDIKGQEIRTLVNGNYPAGTYQFEWNGKDNNNISVAAGVYIYSIQAGHFNKSARMILLK
ncbi:FlgD immunoglobulin-like domain containing protein [Melioribacter sp. OK-6-Me]|uniref:FlgD immunoglobulin-like domain containing protein n=1 Tax=unclassified Melioribacter TaxID=2627329 RepID=UPI003ED91DC0